MYSLVHEITLLSVRQVRVLIVFNCLQYEIILTSRCNWETSEVGRDRSRPLRQLHTVPTTLALLETHAGMLLMMELPPLTLRFPKHPHVNY